MRISAAPATVFAFLTNAKQMMSWLAQSAKGIADDDSLPTQTGHSDIKALGEVSALIVRREQVIRANAAG